MAWIMLYDAIVVICMTYIFITTKSAWAFLLLIALAGSETKDKK